MPQAFSQPVLWNPLQRWLKGNRLKPLPPHLGLSLLCLLRSVPGWGRGPCCCAVLGPAALMGVGEPLCSAFPSLHSVTSHHQLEIGQGGVFTQWKSVNCYKWRLFFPLENRLLNIYRQTSGHRYSPDSSQVEDVGVVIGDYVLNSPRKILEVCGHSITVS